MAPIRCPVCGKCFDPAQSQAMPFCSERCRQIDLGRWLGERYAFPGQPKSERPERPPESEPPETLPESEPPSAGEPS